MSEISSHDELWPTRRVLQRYGVCARTIDRWVADEALGFPQPIVINKRRYFRERQLVEWERSAAGAAA
jgi:predicted DNA-binding transcriptional regulator AlpA